MFCIQVRNADGSIHKDIPDADFMTFNNTSFDGISIFCCSNKRKAVEIIEVQPDQKLIVKEC